MGTLLNGIAGRTAFLTSFMDRLTEDPFILTLCLGIVFVVLILIIQLIYVIKSGSDRKSQASGDRNKNQSYVDNVIAQIEKQESQELMDYNELVAVITAAIHASMGSEVPADGFVVRSIRKVDTRRRIHA